MNIKDYGNKLSLNISKISQIGNTNTLVNAISLDIIEMVKCYAYDGDIFYKKEDLVNSCASYAYGYGWLDAGTFLGYINGNSENGLIDNIDDLISVSLQNHLLEKTNRYQKMLSSALDGVYICPDIGTRLNVSANDILNRVSLIKDDGDTKYENNDLINALFLYSYIYGWLDVGVRTGLFGIKGDRHLFTI
ncbi:MAG TPA: DUF357 domain-containing protein [Methanocorpusculum sp.]|nr:DUF357 domain-containing protein [Methanocorpusculum sp.]